MRTTQKGFSAIELLVILIFIGVIVFVGWYTLSREDNTKQQTPDSLTQESNNKQQGSAEKSANVNEQSQSTFTGKYLNIPEMGIKIKLTSNIEDAYYVHRKFDDKNFALLSVHSLDKYPGCIASQNENGGSGLASISTFKHGEESPIAGDMLTAYPNSPNINGLYYYTSGSQYDCTEQNDSLLYSKVRKELVESYKNIEKL